MKKVWLLLLALIIIPSVFAVEGHVKLLALLEENGNSTGTLADLYLETIPGNGRVFLETFPLTKIATQVSMRFAEQVACTELEKDCSDTDFLYAIRAAPGIVGGPSAGGVAAVLAAALIDGRTLDPSVAMTGTINSGGLIGPVGGVKQKVEAAAKGGIKTVLIPAGTAQYKEGNETINLYSVGEQLGVTIVEVATLQEALEQFTGKPVPITPFTFAIDTGYATTMKAVAEELCARTMPSDDERIQNLTLLADTQFAQGAYYPAASYCFRANLAQHEDALADEDFTDDSFKDAIAVVLAETLAFDSEIERKPLATITDVQTYMLVKERIQETTDTLEKLAKDKLTNSARDRLAYAEERLISAKVWAKFFGTSGKTAIIDNQTLSNACQEKLGEAEERVSYVQTFYPEPLIETERALRQAEKEGKEGKYVQCLHDAAKAKAEADTLISVTGVETEFIDTLIDLKLNATRRSLMRAQSKGSFPVIGHSYYEYANALKKEDPYSALLFAEYASELSTLDVYFAKPEVHLRLPWQKIGIAIVGVVLGYAVAQLRKPTGKRRK